MIYFIITIKKLSYGLDYNNFFNRVLLPELYDENFKHWGNEQMQTSLLKCGAFFENKNFKLIEDKSYIYYINR